MYQITFWVPDTHVDLVKVAMFNQGAGEIGNYKHCSWQVLGEGQFMPMSAAQPFIGASNELSVVPEYCVQMTCRSDVIEAVIGALKKSHPYEVPAYHVIKLETF